MTLLTCLKELAEKATPGPWVQVGASVFMNKHENSITCGGYALDQRLSKNAAFIGACNPETILRLVEACDKMKDRLIYYRASTDGGPADDTLSEVRKLLEGTENETI